MSEDGPFWRIVDYLRAKAPVEELIAVATTGYTTYGAKIRNTHRYDHIVLRTITNFFVAMAENYYLANYDSIFEIGPKVE